jgi:hypothetical protein
LGGASLETEVNIIFNKGVIKEERQKKRLKPESDQKEPITIKITGKLRNPS